MDDLLITESFSQANYQELRDSPAVSLAYISECLRHNRISVMVGAGFSKNACPSFPNWNELLIPMLKNANPSYSKASRKKCLDYFYNNGTFDVVDLYIKKTGHRESVEVYIENQLDDFNDNPNTLELHKLLLQINWNDVFTTNWDTLLEQANVSSYDVFYHTVKRAKDLCFDNKKRIVKLHGTLRNKKEKENNDFGFDNFSNCCYILSKKDFDQYHIEHEDFSSFMRVKILETPLVLLGFSGTDQNFLYWVKQLKNAMTKGGDTTKPNPIFLISMADKEPTEDEKLFYSNNYIISLKLADLYDLISKKSKSADFTGHKSITKKRDFYNEMKVFLEYLKNATDGYTKGASSENAHYADHLSKLARSTEGFTQLEKEKYLQLPKFCYDNLSYTDDLRLRIYRTANDITKLQAIDFELIYKFCLDNFYSLSNVFEESKILDLINAYCSNIFPVAQGKDFMFVELILKYYREYGKTNEFDDLLNKLDSTNDSYAKNISYYQKGLACIYSVDDDGRLEQLSHIIETWQPENDSDVDSLYVLRKIHLILAFKNSQEIRGYSDQIRALAGIAEKNCPKKEKQLMLFVYQTRIAVADDFDSEKINYYRELLNQGLKEPYDFVNRFIAKPKDENDKEQLHRAYINATRLLNFDEYTGCALNLEKSKEAVYNAIELMKVSYFHLARMMIALIPSFSESYDEKNLLESMSKILRYFSSDELSKLFDFFFKVLNHKANNNLNARVFFFILVEILKRLNSDTHIQMLVDFIKEKITQGHGGVIRGIAAGQIWGIKIPFEWLLEHLHQEDDFDFFINYVVKEYLADQKELLKMSSYSQSEFLGYYYALVNNNRMSDTIKEEFFNAEENAHIFEEDSKPKAKCELCLFGFNYLTDEFKSKTVAWLETNYSITLSPFFLKYVAQLNPNSVAMKQQIYELVEKNDFKSYSSADYSLTSIVNVAVGNFSFSDEELAKLASIIYGNFSKIKFPQDFFYDNYKFRVVSDVFHCFVEINEKIVNKNIGDFMNQFDALEKQFEEMYNEVSSLKWLDFEEAKNFVESFALYTSYCSYRNKESELCFICVVALSKLLTQNATDLIKVLEIIVNFYDNNLLKPWLLKNSQIKVLLEQLCKKFENKIPTCYDDLYVRELVQKIDKILKT